MGTRIEFEHLVMGREKNTSDLYFYFPVLDYLEKKFNNSAYNNNSIYPCDDFSVFLTVVVFL